MIELVNPTAIGKRADWIVIPRKLKKDCSRMPSSSKDKGLIKLDRIKRSNLVIKRQAASEGARLEIV